MRGKCERRGGNINADGAGAEVFAGDGCSQGTSFVPMAAISRRGQGGRIYNNTRTRERLRRKCVKPADLTTHSPPKTFARPRSPDAPFPSTSARPRTATRPSRTLPLSPTQRQCTPADLTTHSPPKICSRPRTATRPSPALLPHPRSPDARPPTSPPIPRRRPSPVPAQRRPARALSHSLPEHFRSPTQRRCTPADLTTHSPPKICSRPRTTTRPSRTLSHPLPLPSCHIPAAPTHTRRLRDTFLVEDLLPSPSVPLRAQKNGTAQWMCDAECLGRPSLRSVIGIGEPRAVRHRYGALACRRGA